MEVVTGTTSLNQIYKNKQINHLKRRSSFQNLIGYLYKDNNSQVCVLYGLQRTGKATLMAQAAATLDSSTVLWIHCEIGDSMQDVKNAIQTNPACRFIFINEATRLENFIDTSSILADKYCADQGKKVILTGSDSLKIRFSLNRGLYDRAYMIHTTYISFKEHRYLLGKYDIDSYIEYGGILTNGNVLYHENNFHDFDYINSAIAINIQRSLEEFDNGGSFGPLLKLYADNNLMVFIGRIIENASRNFLATTITNIFESHELKAPWAPIVTWLKNADPLTNMASKDAESAINNYLQAMDVIDTISEAAGQPIIFTQPGLLYSQVQKLIHTIEHSQLLSAYTPSEQKLFRECLDRIVKGKMLEDILYFQSICDTGF